MKQIAIIAPTASGKTSLSIDVAHKFNAVILSLDSLAIYKEINIASAKPSMQERNGIIHFGIDSIYPNEKFDVMKFIELYLLTKKYALTNNKNIIIVGGTGFYLKVLLDGISKIPSIDSAIVEKVQHLVHDTSNAYSLLETIDAKFARKIKSNDKYRIEKALCLYYQTNEKPSVYYEENKPESYIDDISIYEIDWEVDLLKERIAKRTKHMIKQGIIDEAIYIERKYTRSIPPIASIGLKESLDYLDGKYGKIVLEEKITQATVGLAKRQRTFNKGQFSQICKKDYKSLRNELLC